jgi:hypothetical protein
MSEHKKINFFKKLIAQLQELHNDYPNQSVATHFAIALQDYGNIWGLSDKEVSFAIEKYQVELELNNFIPDKDLDKIIEEGKNLDKINLYDDESDEEDDYGNF